MNSHLEAEYEDGYVHSELELEDASPFSPGKNVFHDILEGHPTQEHGGLVRLTLFINGVARYDIDWTNTPVGARPIRYKEMERDFTYGQKPEPPRIMRIGFGYQWIDAEGQNQQVLKHIEL